MSASPSRPAAQLPVVMLIARLVLFAVFQALIAVALALGRVGDAWDASAAWWPISVTLANVVTIGLLASAARREGSRLTQLYGLGRQRPRDLLALVPVLIGAAVLGGSPPGILSALFLGEATRGEALMVRPLPEWAAIISLIAFPITISLAELPAYFGYAMPRLATAWRSRALAVIACSGALAAQHVTAPLIFNGGFVVWRALMFLPFALLLGAVLDRRPSLLPYLMVVHAALDLVAAARVLDVST